jgi:hypothetical protein
MTQTGPTYGWTTSESHSKVKGAIPVTGDGVKGTESLNMFGMLVAKLFDAKIINRERER